jgi:hypothetical protein
MNDAVCFNQRDAEEMWKRGAQWRSKVWLKRLKNPLCSLPEELAESFLKPAGRATA